MTSAQSYSLTLLLFWTTLAWAQDPGWNERIQQLSFPVQKDTEYRLGQGDLIELLVFGAEDLHSSLRVTASGNVNIPLLGAVGAAGLTAGELEADIARRLAEQELVNHAQVSVLIREYRSKPVFVLGAVGSPGEYQMTRPHRLIDVIAMAGGIKAENAAGTALIQRRYPGADAGEKASETIEVDLTALLARGDQSLNIAIQGGDTVQIPSREVSTFYLIGDVHQPGAYELPTSKRLLLTQAVAQAGGPLRTAKASKSLLLRYDQSGQRQEIPLDIRAVLTGKQPDLPIQPDDVIFVPGSIGKDILYSMLGAIPRTVAGTVTRIPVR